jgi:hypothetical protein
MGVMPTYLCDAGRWWLCFRTPILFCLALHRRRIRILKLKPILRSAGAIARAKPLGHDAFQAHGAGMPKYDFAGMRQVLIEL